ncbi:MAG: NAD(+) synthase [Dethiobacter sp.]|jgi:NAD+ synthase (glutamine-hydrolysing)|nr:NAD(+) synthase [Dethiobacter sp.]MBS3897542.1 NAD(+) synthase [Dethiobacter sp.]MBS3982191.1 NAD(+) synthase [Dethiobacter sp.]MCL4463325.1 NAD(+) synthase [Bacillota bacterium]MCL5993545.1 NAD(+) synthase [Bacillota bacterium]
MNNFFNFYKHGFIRVAAAISAVQVADPVFNVNQTIELAKEAEAQKAVLALFPELGISAYSNEDLFHQQALLEATETEIARLLDETSSLNTILVVGAPVPVDSLLYNCGLVLHHGRILGIVPKTYLPNYSEFYEARQFRPADAATRETINYCGRQEIPFGTDLLFQATNIPGMIFALEICEDLWVPVPPSSFSTLAGATVIVNLSASNITVGKANYRRNLVANQSARCLAAYLYSAAGPGESTTDLAWDGHALIYENGHCLAESTRFDLQARLILSEIDLDRLTQERMRQNTFAENAQKLRKRFRTIACEVRLPEGRLLLSRQYSRFPYVPSGLEDRDLRCYEAYNIQVHGLIKRLQTTGLQNIIVGISGGLDSTQALTVAVKAVDLLGWSRERIRAYTMPGFATSQRTKANAWQLISALGVKGQELDIRESCQRMLEDIGHPQAGGNGNYDVTYENVQAGQRTSTLFRLANLHNGLVLGTGDLSEIALGWSTYGVGDHMSHYNVNASVPKTLIQYLLRWQADPSRVDQPTREVLLAILATEISPELVPGKNNGSQPAQLTEDFIGPYELQDFNIYYTTRLGYRPSKVAFLAYHAWRDKELGDWPDIPFEKRRQYTLGEIKHWLGVFCKRFYALSQFKRSVMPNGPKIGSGGSLSPRGDWRAPSDNSAAPWLSELAQIPDKD